MVVAGIITSLWIGLIGIVLGLASIGGLCPLSVAYLASCCIKRKGVPMAYLGIVLGMAVKQDMASFGRYGITMLGIAMLLCGKSFDELGRNPCIMAFFSGVISAGVNISVAILIPGAMQINKALFEALAVMSMTVIYHKAMDVLIEDRLMVSIDSAATIAVVCFFASILYGLPIQLGNIVVAEPFAMFTILCALYCFGLGTGLAWTCVCGVILSISAGSNIYMTAWIPVAIISYAIAELLHSKRLMYSFVFGICYLIAGIYFFDEMVTENGIKALLSAMILFVLMPGGILLKLDKKLRHDELSMMSPEWGRLVVGRISDLANAFKRIDYSIAYSTDASIGFKDVGNLIEDFTTKLEHTVPLKKTLEAKIIDELKIYNVEVKSLLLIKDEKDKLEVYITSRVKRGRLITADLVRKIIEENIGLKFILNDESRNLVGRNYEVICMHQRPDFKCLTAIRRLSKYEDHVSGDNYLIDELKDGQKLVIIADGMGNGERASRDSLSLIESLEDLLSAGFDKEMSIKIVNSFLANRNHGETFTTLDMLLVDLYTGHARLYKQGAATTYVKRGEWLEEIKSTSLPVGIVDGAVCESCTKKLFEGDLVIMISDGLLESIIVENNDDFMRDLLMTIEYDDPNDIADEIIETVKAQSGNRLKDDATVIVSKLVKSL